MTKVTLFSAAGQLLSAVLVMKQNIFKAQYYKYKKVNILRLGTT